MGGGQIIPIELTLSKDYPVHGGQQINCSLIDETDTGLYVIGDGEQFATFIPRTAVAFIHYGQGDKHTLFGTPQQQQLQSQPQAQPQPQSQSQVKPQAQTQQKVKEPKK
jgi:hypothetical protein